VKVSLANGSKLKCLTIADAMTLRRVFIKMDHDISGNYVTNILERAVKFRDYPSAIRTYYSKEFISRMFMARMHHCGIEHLLIQPGKPTQNA